jgi:hypothetical protein
MPFTLPGQAAYNSGRDGDRMNNKSWKMIAREWLIFLGFLVFQMTIYVPLIIFIVDLFAGRMSKLFQDVLSIYPDIYNTSKYNSFAWLLMFAPYIIFQLCRSIRWAISIVRSEEK